jgi:hypothetical protein
MLAQAFNAPHPIALTSLTSKFVSLPLWSIPTAKAIPFEQTGHYEHETCHGALKQKGGS